MASFIVPFMGSSINLAMPQIGSTLSLKAVSLTWMATAYMIATAVFQIPFARLADMVGRRRVFEWGLVGFAVATVLSGFAPTGGIMILLRCVSGLFSAMIFGTNIAILTASFPADQRGKALGVNTAVVYTSLALGPFLGGMLTHYWGWESIFFVCGAMALAVFVLSRVFLHGEWIEAHGVKFDFAGSALYGLGLFGIIYGFTSLPAAEGFLWVAAGIAALAGFAVYEKRIDSPIFDVRLFSGNRMFALSSLSALINYAATTAVAFMLSLYLQYVRGFDTHYAGMILISQAAVQAVCSLAAGRLSDRVSATKLTTLGMAICSVGLAAMFFISASTPVWMLVAMLVVLGAGFGIFSSPNSNVIMSSVGKQHYGQASAVMGTMRLAGQSFSMGIAAMAIAMQVGNREITAEVFPQFSGSMHITFGVFAILCLIGVYASSKHK